MQVNSANAANNAQHCQKPGQKPQQAQQPKANSPFVGLSNKQGGFIG